MAKIFNSVAIAAGAGAGLAFGLSSLVPTHARAKAVQDIAVNDILDLEPLLDRIEALERRVGATLPEDSPDLHAPFEVALEQSRGDILQSCAEVTETLIDQKLTERLEPLERILANHSATLDALRERVEITDRNLQQLISAIERLLDRDAAHSGPAAANGSFQDHFDAALHPTPGDLRRRFPASRS